MLKKIILFCFACISVFAQEQHEPQNWKKLRSPYANIIFKQGQEQDAQKIANTIAYIQKYNTSSIGHHYHTIDIILRANTIESNGFVTVSPFRSEFFNAPPPTYNNLGTTDWLSTLAIHEYRHVLQFLNHKSGATNILYNLFGESGWGLGSVLAVPDWYFEGDAVTTETALTKSGRGRLPKFTALQRANYKSNHIYNYQKARNGSYKDLVPNHYVLGYQMLNYYRNHFEASKLDDIARKAASFQFPFYGFSYQMHRETGLGTKKMYYESVEENQNLWQEQRTDLNVIDYKSVNKRTEKINIYSFPQLTENDDIITLKSSLDKIPAFYKIDQNGNETKITSSIYNTDSYFHYNKNKLVFTGIDYDVRYNYTNYNNIYIYDLISKQKRKITHKKRYFSPSFNKDNSKIIVSENNQNNSKIIILNTSGNPIKTIEVTGHVSRPKFIDDENYVYLNQENHQLAIFKINAKGESTQLTPWTSHSIDNINVNNQQVYYSASFNGIDNIYQTPLDGSLEINQITNANIGAYQPNIKNNKIYFTEQTSKGNNISFTEIRPEPFYFLEPVEMDWNNDKTVDFEKGNILDKIENKNYHTTNYTSIFEDLKFHDWGYSLDDELISANITATNLLDDFSLLGNVDLYPNENGSLGLGARASYKKWFPIFNLGINLTYRNFDETLLDPVNDTPFNGAISFNQFALTPSITIPLSQVNGNYTNNMSLNVGYELDKISNTTFTLDDSGEQVDLNDNSNFKYTLFNAQFTASSLRRKASQHINSHAGITASLNYNKTLTGDLEGDFLNATSTMFFPGLLNSHNSYITFAYRNNNVTNDNLNVNLIADSFSYARGFNIISTKSAKKLSLNYQLPLLYPDFGILGITYFKRIRANLFADFSNISYFEIDEDLNINSLIKNQNSIGFEVIFDNTYLNIGQAEIGIGYRGSYLLNTDIVEPNNKYVGSIFLSTVLF